MKNVPDAYTPKSGPQLTITGIANPQLDADEPAVFHDYDITGFPSDPLKLRFHRPDLSEDGGPNGVTDSALLAVLIDRAAAQHPRGAVATHLRKAAAALHRLTK